MTCPASRRLTVDRHTPTFDIISQSLWAGARGMAREVWLKLPERRRRLRGQTWMQANNWGQPSSTCG